MQELALAGAATWKPAWVAVSAELTIILQGAEAAVAPIPEQAIAFLFSLTPGAPAMLTVQAPAAQAADEAGDLQLLLAEPAFLRLGGSVEHLDDGAFHLPSELRGMALALQACELSGERGFHYRSAKAVELLCEAMRLLEDDSLTPVALNGDLSMADSRQIMAARDYIDQHCDEALTLEVIGRACGLGRAKLSRGFRTMFDCTVAEAIAGRRLMQASQLLRTTDLPVSSIAYRSGYHNNASFARAFGRRFGVPPSSYRSCGVAA